jgi:hypothetical protein
VSDAHALQAITPAALHATLLADAGGTVDGAEVGALEGAPAVDGLEGPRATALLAAWTGARLHAGASGLIAAADPDVALLVGDWCFAHALGAVAREGDLQAIALLSHAIDQSSTGPTGIPASAAQLSEIWAEAGRKMTCSE